MKLAWLLLAASLLLPAAAVAARFRIDPVHTQVGFRIDHLGFSRATGWFRAVGGSLELDPDALAGGRAEIEVEVASLDLGDPGWNRAMLKRRFFDVERHPRMLFRSSRVELADARSGVLHGELELLGRRLPLALDFRLNRHGIHKYSTIETIGFSASGRLRRSAFGMTAMIPDVGDQIELLIEVEAQREPDQRRRSAPGKSAP